MHVVIKKMRYVRVRWILFISLILAYCLTTSDAGNSSSSFIKYAILGVCVIYSGMEYMSTRRRCYKKEYFGLFIFAILVIGYSLVRSIFAWHFSFRTIQEMMFLLCPMLYGYFVINTWTKDDIETAMVCTLILAFSCYMVSLGMNFNQLFNALFNSSFSNSYSELESFTYCGLAIALCLYFCYYNKNKLWTVLSFLFVIMTFKRLFIVIAVILFILSNLKIREINVSNKWINTAIFILFITGVTYYFLMQPENVMLIENKLNIDVTKLTMTRNDRMRWLVTSLYKSYGFGSSTEYMYARFYGALEMEASKIIIELGFIPLLMMFRGYMKFAKTNLYVFIFMLLMMLNLIVSSGLTGTFAWTIIFISISAISMYPEKKEDRIKWKKLK